MDELFDVKNRKMRRAFLVILSPVFLFFSIINGLRDTGKLMRALWYADDKDK